MAQLIVLDRVLDDPLRAAFFGAEDDAELEAARETVQARIEAGTGKKKRR